MSNSTNHITLLETIRESFGRTVYTHKTHEKMAEILASKRAFATVSEVVSVSLTASGILSLTSNDFTAVLSLNVAWIKLFSTVLAFITLGLTLYKAFASLDSRIIEHQKTARELWLVREHYINLISDFTENRINAQEALNCRNELQNSCHEIYKNAPQTTTCAYKKAQKALKDNEDFTFTAKEIDCFLPKSLKINKP